MRIILLVIIALLLAGCGGNDPRSSLAVLHMYIQNPTNNTGSIVIETTKPSDPAFMRRSHNDLPASPTEEGTMDFEKGFVYVVTMKHYDQEDGTGNLLQTVSREVDFTSQSRLEMAFQFD